MQNKTHGLNSTYLSGRLVDWILLLLISVFMIIILFYRGLFFRENYIPAVAIISIIFAAYMVYKLRDKRYRIVDTYMDLSVMLIPVSYLISFFFAVNANNAFDMLLIYCSYFMLYKLTSDLSAKDEKYKDIFINVIIVSSIILSFAGMFSIAGIISLKGSFIEKRLFGLYQYANTTASVLGVGIILTLNKLMIGTKRREIVLYQGVLTSLIAPFIFTLSRGGYLVLTGVLLLNFLLVKARAKLKLLLGIFISLLSSALLIFKFYTLLEEQFSTIYIYYLISIIVSITVIYFIYSFKGLIRIKFTDRAINVVLIIMTIIVTSAAVFIFSVKEPIEYKVEHQANEESSLKNVTIPLYGLEPSSTYKVDFDLKASVESQYSYGIIVNSFDDTNKRVEILNHFDQIGSGFEHRSFEFTTLEDTKRLELYIYNYETNSYTVYKNILISDSNDIVVKRIEKLKYVPSAIADRLLDINLKTANASSRVFFAKDGFKIIKDYPIVGAGGGGWKNLYRQYQSLPYNTTEVHNFYVQYIIEVGIIGLIALAGLLMLIIVSLVASIKAGSSYSYIYLSTLLLLLHSSIDFNLSLVAVGYILWMLVGLINSDKYTQLREKPAKMFIRILALSLSFIICISASFINYGMKLGAQGAKSYKEEDDAGKAIELYEKASQFDRYNSIYRIDLAQIMSNQLRKTNDKKYYDEMNKLILLIRKYEPYNHQYTSTICRMYLAIGSFENASELADQKLQNEPMLIQSYELKTGVNYEIAKYLLTSHKVQEASAYLEKVLEAKYEFEKLNARLRTPLSLEGDYPKEIEAAQRTLDLIKAGLK